MAKIIRAVTTLLSLCFLLLIAVATATSVYCHRHRDEIVQRVLAEINHRFNASIKVSGISIEALQAFPYITLVIKDVTILDPATQRFACTAVSKAKCVFSLWDVLQGKYSLNELTLVQGAIDVNHLYTYLPADKQPPQGLSDMMLHRLLLEDISVTYHRANQRQRCCVRRAAASLYQDGQKLKIHVKGAITNPCIQHGRHTWTPALHPTLDAQLTYNPQRQTIALDTVKLQQDGAALTVTGHCGLASGAPIYLKVQSKGTPISTVLRCLPYQHQSTEVPWRSHISGTVHLTKPSGTQQSMSAQGDLLFRNTTYTTPYLTQPLVVVKEAVGKVCVPDVYDLATARLILDNITGALVGSMLRGSLTLQDFRNPQLKCAAQSQVDLSKLNLILGQVPIQDTAGHLLLNCQLESSVEAFVRGARGVQAPKLTGTVQVHSVRCTTKKPKHVWKDIHGELNFKDNTLTIPALSGTMQSGDFSISGSLHLLLPTPLGTTPIYNAHAKLHVDYLDLDVLLGHESNAAPQRQLRLPDNWVASLECAAHQIHYRRFRGKNMRSTLRVERKKLTVDQLDLGIAGGKGMLSGCVAESADGYNIRTAIKLRGVDLQRLFYMCENFHQTFLTDDHLRGEVLANGHFNLHMNHQGKFSWEKLQGAADIKLHYGALQHFPPIQRLAKYVPEKALAYVRFSPLNTHIKIQNGIVYIPPMEVHSSVTHMKLTGTHALDGKIDYSFEIPLSGLRPNADFHVPEAVAEDALENINAFLRLKGTTTHYQVAHDAQAFRKSLSKKLKEQGTVIQQMLKGQYENKKKTQELAPGDYFEFE
ncbi:MAG: AsmA-like C-terminal region-containing protein [Bacteroidota bacterium]